VRSLRENLKLRSCRIDLAITRSIRQAKVWDFRIATEQLRLLSCLLYVSLIKEKKLFERKSSIYIRRCVCLPIHSSSQTQGNTTQSVNFTTVFLCGKNDCHSPQKGILVSWCHKLMREFFQLFWRNVNAYRKDRKCFKMVQTNGLSVKEYTNASECTAQNNSILAFAFDNISWPSSFWDLWMNFSSLVSV